MKSLLLTTLNAKKGKHRFDFLFPDILSFYTLLFFKKQFTSSFKNYIIRSRGDNAMTENEKEMMNSIFAKIAELDYIKPDEIPNIDLYMDQVTTFMEDNLASTKRHDDDKILTKTMINNYAKNKLLPPPEKKRYSREHLLMLIFIYYFKNILSISDIQTLLGPITEKYFKSVTEKDMTYIYREVFSMEQSQIRYLEKDLMRRFKSAGEIFEDADPEDKEFLHQFSFICLLSFDVYMKKMIIENMIDHMNSSKDTDSSKKDK